MEQIVFEPQNRLFWESFEKFFVKLFRYFKDNPIEIPKEPSFIAHINDDGSHGFTLSDVLDERRLIESNLRIIKSWSEYNNLSNHAVIPEGYGNIIDDNDHFNLDNNFIPTILQNVYEKCGSFVMKKRHLEELYQKIENAVYQENYTFTIRAPVYGLDLEQKSIKLDTNTLIRKVRIDDLELLKPSVYHHYIRNSGYSPFLRAVVETEEIRKKTEPSGLSLETSQKLTDIISSFMVYKKSKFQLGPISIRPKDFWGIFGGTMFLSMPDEVPQYGDTVLIMRVETPKYKKLFSEYLAATECRAWMGLISQKLKRLAFQMKAEEMAVDLVTLLEILFLPEASGELKYRLSIRCAKLLGKNKEDIKKVFELIRLCYDIRSNIVHTGKISAGNKKQLKKAGLSLHELLSQIQGYIFDSVRKFIHNPNLRNEMDEIVLK